MPKYYEQDCSSGMIKSGFTVQSGFPFIYHSTGSIIQEMIIIIIIVIIIITIIIIVIIIIIIIIIIAILFHNKNRF